MPIINKAAKLQGQSAGLLRTRVKQPGRYTFIVKAPMKNGPPLPIPIHVIRGRKSGPTLLVAAGEHGVEVNGVAAIDRVLRETDLRSLRGTFVGIPAINPANVCNRINPPIGKNGQRAPWDSARDWPGDIRGTPGERIAATLTQAVMNDADVIINIHAWSWYSASCAFASPCSRQAMRLARAFGLGFVCFSYTGYCKGPDVPLDPKHNMLTHYAQAHGKPAILAELRTHHWLYPPSVADGMNGIRNVMKTLGMLPGKPVRTRGQHEALGEEIVRAPRGGLFVPVTSIGDRVGKNETLGYLLDLKTGRKTDVKSPCAGAVWLVSRVGKSGGSLPDMHAYADRGNMVALIKRVRSQYPGRGNRNKLG